MNKYLQTINLTPQAPFKGGSNVEALVKQYEKPLKTIKNGVDMTMEHHTKLVKIETMINMCSQKLP